MEDMMKFYTNILGLIFILTMITSCSSTPSRSVSNNNSPISQYDYSRPIVYNGYWFKLGGPNCRTFTEIYKGRMLCKNDKGIPVSYADPLTDQQVKAFSAKWFEKHRKQARSNNQIGLFEGVDYLIDSFLDGFNSNTNNSSYNSYKTPPSDYGLSSWGSTTSSWNTVPPSGYKSTYGTKYQYDLSDPFDRIKYKTDPGAQLRDKIGVNIYRDIEGNINEFGGGVYKKNTAPTWNWVY